MKVRVVHYRHAVTFQIACSNTLSWRMHLWTNDAKDVTCDRCLRTKAYRERSKA